MESADGGLIISVHSKCDEMSRLIRKLNTKHHTIAEALASPDYTLMERQRIKTFSRDVFDQLRALK